jgi:tetratricopeptide (TPR) repeat protein
MRLAICWSVSVMTDQSRFRSLSAAMTAALVLILPGASVAAPASALDDPALAGKNRYDRCLELVKRDAAKADTEAAAWAAAGGGSAALHCNALALVELKHYSEAAQKLEDAASSGVLPPLHADLLDQAGNAWLLAHDPARAETAFSFALGFDPKNEDILSDRARERGAAKNWTGAIEDLTGVLAIDADRADIYVLRASALHAQGKTNEARADIAHALDIYPNYPEALVERGTMRLEAGDRAGARTDWQMAAREAPDTDAATTARARLNQLGGISKAKK